MKPSKLLLDFAHPAAPLRDRIRPLIKEPYSEDAYWHMYSLMDAWVHQDKRHAHFIVDDLGERYDPNR